MDTQLMILEIFVLLETMKDVFKEMKDEPDSNKMLSQ